MRTKWQEADTAVSTYDKYVFETHPSSFDNEHANLLASVVVVACEEAARDRTVNQFTRDHYREMASQFRPISDL